MQRLEKLRRSGRHFDGEPPPECGAGIEARYKLAWTATGKTIDKISYGEDQATVAAVAQGEYIVFHFSDGTALSLQTVSDAGNLEESVRGFKASSLTCSFWPIFHNDRTAISLD